MIDPTKLTIPINFCLIKPDGVFETYQVAGKETGIIAPQFKYDKGKSYSDLDKHVSVSGQVYGIPERLVYNGDKIRKIQLGNDWQMDRSLRKTVDHLRETTVQFDVDIDVKVGDKVYFDYLAYKSCLSSGRIIPTTEGHMLLIKYDMLIMAIRKESVIMLNGYLLVENEVEPVEEEDGVVGTMLESGIFLPQTKKKAPKARKQAKATIIHSGGKVKRYLDFHSVIDGDGGNGDNIIYDPRHAKDLEFGLHQIFSDKKLKRIQRKDIFLVL